MDEPEEDDSPSRRFLGPLRVPSSSPPLELDESEVIWSTDYSSGKSPENSPPTSKPSPETPPSNYHRRHGFKPARFGLSAALSEDHRTLVQRQAGLNPSFAARAIPPVPIRQGSSGSDDLSSAGSGKFHQSAPVNVPVWSGKRGEGLRSRHGIFEEESDDFDEERMPPHEIVARSHMDNFSVFEGVGRTLKGRDLRRVRNAVWQKTGFLD
ncbi:uncharacterized protein LOC18438884 [Amborella trichopoda]|uniref:Senescence regulator S40 n=1 Tax=Amborella trichopoda TaxID=13333 RepID=W1PTU7_AMBTC|nr:uncharacterized protein LOC18438884 [Amborella trichopoda]ERN10700.1 hypothetical protein AMTR_s00027p00044330 [Amborella trichopoda]|eukprot:XP_011625154.1 uncharacterized protein LOC18438884 [Amborella trichopoda]